LTALAMLGLAGMAMVTMASHFASEARRTMDSQIQTQLRQLLVAGGIAARQRIESPAATADHAWYLPLPTDLADQQATLTVKLTTGARDATATVGARVGGKAAQQTLRFARDGNRWQLVDARLDP
jgi:hypothetical protein